MVSVNPYRQSRDDLNSSGSSSDTHSLPIPPHQIPAEQAVLGAIMMDNEQFEKVSGLLSVEDFYHQNHRLIYDAMLNLFSERQNVDLTTLPYKLERMGELENVGGVPYLASIQLETPHAVNTESYAKIVVDCSLLRRLLKSSQRIQQMVYNRDDTAVEKVLSDAQQLVYELGREFDRGDGLTHVKESANSAFTRIEELYNDPTLSSITGISSGFIDLDKLTSGFQRSDLVIIAGRPSMGKTALAMNVAEHAAIVDKMKVAVFSLEMPAIQLTMRSLSSLSSINSKLIREGKLGDGREGEQNWEQLSNALNILNDTPIYIDATPGISPLEISARSRRMKREIGLDLIIVDYLQLLQMKDNESNRATELSNITRELKFLAKELEVPVIALSQLNRGVEQRPNKRPLMSDLRESGAIEQDADLIIFIYRDEVYKKDTEDYGLAEIIVAKHRNGDIGDVTLRFMREFTRFDNYSRSTDASAADIDIVPQE